MAASPTLGHLTSRYFNPLSRPIMGRLPGCALVVHLGRRSGTARRTPVNVYRADESYAIALTFGPAAQWVQNVLAAGGCELRTRGRTVRLVDPRVVTDPTRSLIPRPMRTIQRLIGVDEYLVLRPAG